MEEERERKKLRGLFATVCRSEIRKRKKRQGDLMQMKNLDILREIERNERKREKSR